MDADGQEVDAGLSGEPLLAKKKKKARKKKKKKKAPRVARGFVTSSTATPAAVNTAPAEPERSAKTPSSTASSSSAAPPLDGDGDGDDASTSSSTAGAGRRRGKTGRPQQKHTSARQQQTWSLHLPAPLASMFAANKRDNVPAIRLDGDLESALMDEITRLENNTASATAPSSSSPPSLSPKAAIITPTFKRLNAQYVALERFGFAAADIQRAMRANLARPFADVLSWCCLNVDHDDLPAGFTDKGANQLDTKSGATQVCHTAASLAGAHNSSAGDAWRHETALDSAASQNDVASSGGGAASATANSHAPTASPDPPMKTATILTSAAASNHAPTPAADDHAGMDAAMKQRILMSLAAEEDEEEAALLREMALERMSPRELHDALSDEILGLSAAATLAKGRKDKVEQKRIGLEIRALKARQSKIVLPSVEEDTVNVVSKQPQGEKEDDGDASAGTDPESRQRDDHRGQEEQSGPIPFDLGAMFEETEDDDVVDGNVNVDADEKEATPDQPSSFSHPRYFKSLLYRQSWTGKSPRDLLIHLTRRRKRGQSKKLANGKPKLAQPRFTRTCGPGAGGFRYCVDLQAGLSKAVKTDLRVYGSGRLGYDGRGDSTDARDLPCRTDAEAKNLAATVALYALFPDQNIYVQLPRPFRDLWKGWTAGIEENAAKEEKERHADKVALCTALEEAWHDDPRSQSRGIGSSIVPHRGQSAGAADLEEDWAAAAAASAAAADDDKGTGSGVNAAASKIGNGEASGNSVTTTGSYPQRRRRPAATSSTTVRTAFLRRTSGERYRALEKTRRQDLPVMRYEAEIVEAVSSNKAVVVQGETGCGKSTQIPHILLKAMMEGRLAAEGGDVAAGEILCTEPRRISATSLARRVCHEMGDGKGGRDDESFCGYQIRGERKTSRSTLLTYMTTGILLRRLQSDPNLAGVSVVVVDEVHERTVQSDFLLIALKRLLRGAHSGIRVVLMSATMDAEKVARYMGRDTPVMAIPGRTFPVSVQYLEDIVERTGFSSVAEDEDMRSDASAKRAADSRGSVQLTRNTGRGGRLNFSMDEGRGLDDLQDESGLDPAEYSLRTRLAVTRIDTARNYYDLIERTLRHICEDEGSPYGDAVPGAVLVFLPGVAEITRMKALLESTRAFSDARRYRVCALHSALPMQEQQRAFEIPPAHVRKIILSTNVAETGVTIPDAVFVVDTCLVKETRFDDASRMRSLVQCRVPRSSAEQRRGRAGRVRDGFCFRLITRWEYDNTLAPELTPEIRRVPLTELVLGILVSSENNAASGRGDHMQPMQYLAMALDPPEPTAVGAALQTLSEVGAIVGHCESSKIEDAEQSFGAQSSSSVVPRHLWSGGGGGDVGGDAGVVRWRVLPLGFHLAKIPADVRIAKMLLMGAILQCASPVATVAAALSDKSPFLAPIERRAEARMARKEFSVDQQGNHMRSDHLCVVRAFDMWEKMIADKGRARAQAWCRSKFLSWSTLHSIKRTRNELLGYLRALGFISHVKTEKSGGSGGGSGKAPATIASDRNARKNAIVLAAVASGLWPNIATATPRAQAGNSSSSNSSGKSGGHKPKKGGDLPAVRTKRKAASIHPASVNHGVPIKALLPTTVHGESTSLRGGGFLCFHAQMKTSAAYLRDTSVVPAAALLLLCGHAADAKVLFGKRRVAMDGGWLEVGVASKTAVLLLRMREHIGELLLEKIADPRVSIQSWRGGMLGKLLLRVLDNY